MQLYKVKVFTELVCAIMKLVSVADNVAASVRMLIMHTIAGIDESATPLSTLPVPLPIALSRQTLHTCLRTQEYVVCEKTDGERVLLVIVPAGISHVPAGAYLVNRALNVTTFECAEAYATLWVGGVSVLDGELLPPQVGRPIERAIFLMFDALQVNDASRMEQPFTERMAALGQVRAAFKAADAHAKLPLYVMSKEFVPARNVDKVLALIETLPDGGRVYRNGIRVNSTDGLIFTPVRATYKELGHAWSDMPLLKWKFDGAHTIDFLVSASEPTQLQVAVSGGAMALASWARVPPAVASALKTQGTVIAECVFECATAAWKFVRLRPGKTNANFVTTAWHTLERVAENLTASELVHVLCGKS